MEFGVRRCQSCMITLPSSLLHQAISRNPRWRSLIRGYEGMKFDFAGQPQWHEAELDVHRWQIEQVGEEEEEEWTLARVCSSEGRQDISHVLLLESDSNNSNCIASLEVGFIIYEFHFNIRCNEYWFDITHLNKATLNIFFPSCFSVL